MGKVFLFLLLAGGGVALSACHSHIDLQYTPEQYAKLRGIELLTSVPARPYEVVVDVRGSGGRHTAKETMINAMIDAAQKAGARALIPLPVTQSEPNSGGKLARGLDVFVHTENGRTVTKGQAIQWLGN